MAWVLNLFHGSTTVNLVNESGIKVLREDFKPTVGPDKTETGITTDSYRAFINASSVSTLQGFIRSANYAFLMARERQLRNAGDRVYMNVAVDGDSTEYRSEVLDGDVIPDGIYNPNWTNGEAWVTLMITRRNWFEGPETTLNLSNANSTGGTAAGLIVYMCNDGTTDAAGTRNNYAEITGSEITGDLPGFGTAVFTMSTSSASAAYTGNFTLFSQIGRTADAAAWLFDYGDTTDVECSGGLYSSIDFSSGEVTGISGTILGFENIDTMNRILARFGFTTGAGTYKVIPTVSIRFGNTEQFETVYVTPSDSAMHVFSLGVGIIGHNSYDTATTFYGKTVELSAYADTGAFLIDFMLSHPADTLQDYKITNFSLNYPTVITNDTILDEVSCYQTLSGTFNTYNNISVGGDKKIRLLPGINQRLILCSEPWHRSFYATTVLKYRPRRSTL